MKERISDLLARDRADEAIALLDNYRKEGGKMDDSLFYLLGNDNSLPVLLFCAPTA